MSSAPGARDVWVDDPDFDIHRHVTVHELGGEGGRAELQAFLEARFSEPLERDRPMWRTYILEGNEFGAVMTRYHHSIADGTALARILIEMSDDDPGEDAADLPAVAQDRVHPADAGGRTRGGTDRAGCPAESASAPSRSRPRRRPCPWPPA